MPEKIPFSTVPGSRGRFQPRVRGLALHHSDAFDRFHRFPATSRLVLLGIIDSGRVPGDETSWVEPPSVVPSTAAVVITTVATPITVSTTAISATGEAARARVTPGIGIPTTAGEGCRPRAIPTTAAPSPGVEGHEKHCHADGNSESEYFAQHSNFYRLVVNS
jgi:hypothetical protein